MREIKRREDEFFRVGAQLGISWFRLYLAESLAEQFPSGFQSLDTELFKWFLLHLAVQAGSGHLRCDLESLEVEMGEWYPGGTLSDGGRRSAEFDASLPEQLAGEVPRLVAAGLESGLISRLDGENSRGDALDVPRPPLVLTHDDRFLYFLRRRKEEDFLLAALEARTRPGPGGPGKIGEVSVPAAPRDTPAAVLLGKLAEGRRLLLLAGGPGTGKTTTVAQLLKLLDPQPGGLEVVLAAPTGRAAARMSDSLEISGRTIHSLLGIFPGRLPRYNADRPLAADLVIVDEASMVDLPLMNALLDAVPDRAALLLVGDPDQLPSVEAGAILGDLLYGAADAAEAAGGGEMGRKRSPLAGSVVRLTKVYRSDTAILEAASAVRRGDFDQLKSLLGAVRLHAPGTPETMAWIIAEEYREAVSAAGDTAVDEADLFKHYSAHAVLTPLRRGPWGVPAMNERISRNLGGTAGAFPGMPVMITRNDPSRDLWNGDRGVIVLRDGRLRAAFPGIDGAHDFPLAALPGWEAAWIQTIHKSQGSEFDSVGILLPEGAERLLSREILYTAFTRARHTVDLYAALESVEAALERRVVRHSRIRKWAAGRAE